MSTKWDVAARVTKLRRRLGHLIAEIDATAATVEVLGQDPIIVHEYTQRWIDLLHEAESLIEGVRAASEEGDGA